MRYAVVSPEGVVQNVILWDGIEALPRSLSMELLVALTDSDQVSVGWVYQGGVFTRVDVSQDP
jgi:hypothetical protein